MRRYVLSAVALFFFVAGVVTAYRAGETRNAYEKTVQRLTAYAKTDMLVKYKLGEWAQTLSFGLYTNKLRSEIAQLETKRSALEARSRRFAFTALALLSIASMIAAAVSLRMFVFLGAVTAGALLFFGLTIPLMSVTLHKTVPYLGDVVFSYESKTLTQAAAKLWRKGDALVAGTIVLFSIVLPTVKSAVTAWVALAVGHAYAHKAVAFFKHLGKWSMLDVFVVAVLLVFLSLRSGDVSRADIGEGLYFFVGYVLLSMVVTLAAERMLRRF